MVKAKKVVSNAEKGEQKERERGREREGGGDRERREMEREIEKAACNKGVVRDTLGQTNICLEPNYQTTFIH